MQPSPSRPLDLSSLRLPGEQSDRDPTSPGAGTPAALDEGNNPLSALFKSSNPMIPFAVIFILYLLFNLRIELFLCVALLVTSLKANTIFTDLTARKKTTTSVLRASQLAALLTLNSMLLLFVYRSTGLQRVLVFLRPHTSTADDVAGSGGAAAGNGTLGASPGHEGKGHDELDIFEVIFLVAIIDFLLKFTTMIVKTIVYLIPSTIIIPRQIPSGKGWVYASIESVSQVYRSLVPMGLWLRLFLQMHHWPEYIFHGILILLALAFKLYELKGLVESLIRHVRLMGSESHRCSPLSSSSRDTCPICLGAIRNPTITNGCMHVFCTLCLQTWSDRDKKCPICRTDISNSGSIDYRDGNTAQYIQVF